MAGVDMDEPAQRHIEHAVEQGGVAGLAHRLVEQPVRPAQDRPQGEIRVRKREHRGAERRHQQRRRNALSRHIAHRDAPAVLAEGHEVVVVASHLGARFVHRSDLQTVEHRTLVREEVLQDLARDLQLGNELAPFDRLLVEQDPFRGPERRRPHTSGARRGPARRKRPDAAIRRRARRRGGPRPRERAPRARSGFRGQGRGRRSRRRRSPVPAFRTRTPCGRSRRTGSRRLPASRAPEAGCRGRAPAGRSRSGRVRRW